MRDFVKAREDKIYIFKILGERENPQFQGLDEVWRLGG
jgi:hypothetical protein